MLGLVLVIVWTLLPFAVFGTKLLLRQLVAEQQETNRLLRAIGEDGRAAQRSRIAQPDIRV